jgi:hypothetical protein
MLTSIPLPREPGEQADLSCPREPEEVLVADARNSLTPAQMVGRKLLALLDNGHPRSFSEPFRRPGDVRAFGG